MWLTPAKRDSRRRPAEAPTARLRDGERKGWPSALRSRIPSGMIELTHYYYFVFGALTIAGGVMGFVKAKSMPSLVAGGFSGALLVVAGALFGSHLSAALWLGLVVSALLAGKFAPAFLKKRAFMPTGMMSVLSVIGLALSLAAFFLR